MPRPPTPFRSRVAFGPAQARAAAVYCSDGRFGRAFDELLTDGLGLPNCDRLALPGGPARLADGSATDELRFLVEAHGLRRVVLIQHAGCGFYAKRLKVAPGDEQAAQRADLARAAEAVRGATAVTSVLGYLARPDPAGVAFDPVEL